MAKVIIVKCPQQIDVATNLLIRIRFAHSKSCGPEKIFFYYFFVLLLSPYIPLHKVVLLVLPLPDPYKPEQHEACCPLGKRQCLLWNHSFLLHRNYSVHYLAVYKSTI